ncbi:E3 ubiquitin-protein ligase SH3RF2 isoform X1 [Schistocerca gregaria]|uniref:E3 ubiquitin-protein ligase SH3RF2 isoform X1 n=1 Tax=Schistocerca gregaria TaxID=7010 RepID=UPI00211EF740|nr:E3 ubiquitin-protein ligase SH3RF2 isoform X1 [Schistocerca gregaria]
MDEWTLNDLLECSVCLERLDTTSKVLPCQHTFCKKCLEEILNRHKELRCPECRILVDVKIEDLPPNVLLMRILEGMRNAAPKKRNTAAIRMQGGNYPQTPIHQTPSVQYQMTSQATTITTTENITVSHAIPKQQLLPNLSYAKALYDYRSQEKGDLNFKKGDIIILRKRIDSNWYFGENGGCTGVFPLSYVQVITPLCSTQPQCKALYDFDEEGCLSFIKGEIITVIRRVDENWAEGKLGERIGIFPLAFVDLNPVARSLMKLSTNSQPGPSRVAPPTPTSEDTAPLIPTDHTRSVGAVPVPTCRSPAAAATGPPPHVHTRSRAAVASDSSSTQSSPSSATTPNTSSGNTSSGSGSGTEPSSPASPPLARPPPDPTLPSPPQALGSGTAAPPPRPTPSVQQRDKRHSFSAVHTGHHHQTSHRLSAEILSPSETSCQEPSSSDQTLQVPPHSTSTSSNSTVGDGIGVQRQGSQRHRRSGSSDLTSVPPLPPPQGLHSMPGTSAHLPAAYIALYPYKPQKADELELRKGAIYMVTERCQDGWFKGTSNRTQKSGVFPGNYVAPANKALPNLHNHLRCAVRVASGTGSSSPRANGTPPLEPRSYTRSRQGPATLPYSPKQQSHGPALDLLTGTNSTLHPPELPPRSTSPGHRASSSSVVAAWLTPASATDTTASSAGSGNSANSIISSVTSAAHGAPDVTAVTGTPVRFAHVSSAVASRDKAKEKKEKGVGLMRRLTSMKKSKSPPPTTYSMDNPVFEDGTVAASPSHPVHVRSGSCPSQLLQVLPLDANSAHHRLFGSGSQRMKHKDRPNVVVANLSHYGRVSDPGTSSGGGSSAAQHRKSNSLDADSCDLSRKNKQLMPPVRERFRCIVPYPPNSEFELELQVGDIIYVHKKRDDGWYKGTQQRTGRTGLFPASFVESF